MAATLFTPNRLRQGLLSNGLPLALPQFRKRSSLVKPTAILCSLALLIVQVIAAPVLAAEDTGADQPRDVYAAIYNHPAVAVQRSQACQALSQVDLAKADIRPQLSARLVGGSSLSSHIERRETHVRRFDDREIDGVLTLEQTLYDWGISDAGIGIAQNSHQAAILGIALEMDRIAADILSIMLSQQELVVVDRLYRGHRQDIDDLAAQVEASVEAGIGRLSDLRIVKVMQLDAEIAHIQAERQMELLRADLQQRFELDFVSAAPLIAAYRQARPEEVPVLDSTRTREVKRLDYELASSALELQRLKAERKPSFTAIVDTTLFDVDSFSQEYEIAGRLQFRMPLYDGGSNAARQQETQWRSRGIGNDRDNLIRNHQSQTEQVLNQIKRLAGDLEKNTAKIAELDLQIEAAKARQGQVESNPLAMANLLNDRFQLIVVQETLTKEIELERLRGLFFANALGSTLNLTLGKTSC